MCQQCWSKIMLSPDLMDGFAYTVPGENNGALSRIIQIRVALSIAQYRLVLLANRVIEVTKIKDKQINSKHYYHLCLFCFVKCLQTL